MYSGKIAVPPGGGGIRKNKENITYRVGSCIMSKSLTTEVDQWS
jgi:hypothetical protein